MALEIWPKIGLSGKIRLNTSYKSDPYSPHCRHPILNDGSLQREGVIGVLPKLYLRVFFQLMGGFDCFLAYSSFPPVDRGGVSCQ